MLKKILLASIILTPLMAFAAEAPKPASDPCGKTVEECQKKADALEAQLRQASAAVQAARQQRDTALSGKADAELQAFLSAQAAK